MPNPTNILALQIQRMLLEDADKQRWLKEMKKLDKQNLKALSDLIHEHDQESLEILNKKSDETEALKKRITSAAPGLGGVELNKDNIKKVMTYLHEALFDVEKLAHFLAASDDTLLSKMQAIFEEASKEKPEDQKNISKFFHEIRLQKVAIQKEAKAKQAEAISEVLVARDAAVKELGDAIAEAEKLMASTKK